MHVTPLFINLYWLPIAACIKYNALMFAYKTSTGSASLYLNALLHTYVPSRSLHSASEHSFIVPSQRSTKSLSRTLKLNVPSCWNDLPISIRVLGHIQESAKNTYLLSLFDPPTLALSILIIFFKKKTNPRFSTHFDILSICFLFIYFTINKSIKGL